MGQPPMGQAVTGQAPMGSPPGSPPPTGADPVPGFQPSAPPGVGGEDPFGVPAQGGGASPFTPSVSTENSAAGLLRSPPELTEAPEEEYEDEEGEGTPIGLIVGLVAVIVGGVGVVGEPQRLSHAYGHAFVAKQLDQT